MIVILKGAARRRIDISLLETGWHPKTDVPVSNSRRGHCYPGLRQRRLPPTPSKIQEPGPQSMYPQHVLTVGL